MKQSKTNVLFCRTSQSLRCAPVPCDSPRRWRENSVIRPLSQKGQEDESPSQPREGGGRGQGPALGSHQARSWPPLPALHRKGRLAWLSHFLLVIIRSIVPEKPPLRASQEPPAFHCLKPFLQRLTLLHKRSPHPPNACWQGWERSQRNQLLDGRSQPQCIRMTLISLGPPAGPQETGGKELRRTPCLLFPFAV